MTDRNHTMPHVHILGSSSATPTATRHPSAQVLSLADQLFLIDCGEGTQMQFRRFRVRAQRIQHIFISHLHGDHYLGLPGLIFTLHLFGRREALHIYANPELEKILNHILEVSATTLLFPLHFHPLPEDFSGIVLENEKMSVTAFPLKHRVPTHGFLFKTKPALRKIRRQSTEKLGLSSEQYRSIREGNDLLTAGGELIPNRSLTDDPSPVKTYAYCSDTGFTDSFLKHIMGVDLLYHEATFMKDKEANAREKEHSTTIDAATIALKAGARKLLIGHYSARYDELQPVLDEARTVFPETYLAEEGSVISF